MKTLSLSESIYLATHTASASVLTQLATHPKAAVRAAAVRNPVVPVEALVALAIRETKRIVVEALLDSPHTPDLIIATLLHPRYHFDIRARAAADARTHPLVLAAYKNDTCPAVRHSLAQNPNTPAEVREALLLTVPTVAESLASTTTEPARLAVLGTHPDATVRIAVAHNRATPVETLTALASDICMSVVTAIADHPRTPGTVLASFLDPQFSNHIRTHAAFNTATPSGALSACKNDPCVFVVRAVMLNPNTPAPVRKEIEARVKNKEAYVETGGYASSETSKINKALRTFYGLNP